MVEIYFLRHAPAVPRGAAGHPGDDRPLTPRGIAKMKRAARGIARVVPEVGVILTSPLARARHTADIAAAALDLRERVVVSPALLPDAPLKNRIEELVRHAGKRRILVVGHEPGLGETASALLGADAAVIRFKKGALCRIDADALPPKRPGRIAWHLTPRHLRLLGKR